MFNLGEISMKKTLIALAVLAGSGAAMAQSTVTLYGVADAFIGSSKVETAGAGQRQNVLNSAGVNGSRWGLKGTEDLGGGLNAVFQLESGFNLDNGSSAQGGRLFGRQAYVGLQGGFGKVTVGRQYTAYDDVHGATNMNYDAATFNASTGGSAGGVAANGMADYTSRADNSVAYASPNFGGFSGSAVYSFGENKNAATNASGDATDNASFALKYANGPVMIGYAYQQEKLGRVLLTAQDKNKYNLIGGSYDFGVVKLLGSYNTAKNNTFKDKEGQVSVVVPFGAAAVSAGYARSKSEGLGVERTGKGYSILGTYDVSKRTRLYAGAQSTKAFILNAANETKETTYGLGVRHAF